MISLVLWKICNNMISIRNNSHGLNLTLADNIIAVRAIINKVNFWLTINYFRSTLSQMSGER